MFNSLSFFCFFVVLIYTIFACTKASGGKMFEYSVHDSYITSVFPLSDKIRSSSEMSGWPSLGENMFGGIQSGNKTLAFGVPGSRKTTSPHQKEGYEKELQP